MSISGNVIESNAGDGIRMDTKAYEDIAFASQDVVIADNTIASNSGNGIFISTFVSDEATAPQHITIGGNQITEKPLG
ncbi:MAG: right-handed parallel beta-helix repeat-containing protein [Dongiaceae bacterium]